MMDTGRGPGLAKEALAQALVLATVADGLDGHEAVGGLVAADVDDAHTSPAQLALDLVAADALRW